MTVTMREKRKDDEKNTAKVNERKSLEVGKTATDTVTRQFASR